MTQNQETVRQMYTALEPDLENPPKWSQILRKVSPRLPRNQWVLIVIIIGLLFLGWLVFSGSGEPERNSGGKFSSTSVMIPEAEITENYLSTFLSSQDLAKRKPAKKEVQAEKAAKARLSPVGPMTIYMSSEASGAVGALGIPMGTELKAVIENSVVASDRSVPVIARLTETFIRDGKLVLPKNARLFGQTTGAVQDRLNIKFSRVVFPNGEEYPFSGVALDNKGAGGVQGKVDRKKSGRGLAVLGGAALGATSIFMPGGASYGDAFARNAHRDALGEAGRDINHYRRTGASPVIKVRANTRIVVLVERAS